MRNSLCMLAGLALFLCPAAAGAQSEPPAQREARDQSEAQKQPKAVVELFTSQGCSSCPAADALLKRMTLRGDIIPLSLNVDYWDHLGWKDTLASPKNSSRQKAYAKALSSGNVYTPQVVVNGAAQAIGSNEAEVQKAIEATTRDGAAKGVTIEAHAVNGKIVVEVGEAVAGAAERSATVWLATVEPKVYVEIKHGENRGRKLGYYNVVRELSPAGMWSGKAMTLELPLGAVAQPGARHVVIVQVGDVGRILGATWVAHR